MTSARFAGLASLAATALLVACTTESGQQPSGPGLTVTAHRSSARWSPWSEPVNLGAPVNSPFLEQSPALSRDGLHLYFSSNRTDLPGALGNTDLWVSRRACKDCPWETPVDLGPVVNSAANDGGPALSSDGHLLFFTSNRLGSNDIYVSRRTHPHDDLGWEPPVSLGPDVNTPGFETEPAYCRCAEDEDDEGAGILYFSRGVGPGVGNQIYSAPVSREGAALGPAVLVAELNTPSSNDAAPTLSRDGRDIIFHSDRPGSVNFDLWISTRRTIHDAWSTPKSLGSPPNSEFEELQPYLSRDGRTLLFRSGPARGGLGSLDLWMSTRIRSADFDSDLDEDEGRP
jgi:hypothetical protein